MSDMPDTEQEQPFAGPWVCFHCGEVCATREEAAIHFGPEGFDEGWKAACVDPLRADEREMRAALVEAHQELSGAREECFSLHGRIEGLEYGIHLLQQREPELMRRLKGATLTDALHNLDSMEGRLLAAEAYVEELRRREPALWQAIQDHICRPLAPAQA